MRLLALTLGLMLCGCATTEREPMFSPLGDRVPAHCSKPGAALILPDKAILWDGNFLGYVPKLPRAAWESICCLDLPGFFQLQAVLLSNDDSVLYCHLLLTVILGELDDSEGSFDFERVDNESWQRVNSVHVGNYLDDPQSHHHAIRQRWRARINDMSTGTIAHHLAVLRSDEKAVTRLLSDGFTVNDYLLSQAKAVKDQTIIDLLIAEQAAPEEDWGEFEPFDLRE